MIQPVDRPAVRHALPGRLPWGGGRRWFVRPSAPWLLVLLALVITSAMLLPLGYLVLRTAQADARSWAVILRPRTLQVLGRTLLLMLGVTGGAVAIAVPVAWLTTCTDLRWRRFWAITTLLPLAIPSYLAAFAVVAALGPRGMLQRLLAPLGVDRLPEIYGFGGAWLVLTLCTYPYVLVSVRAALRGIDPALSEAARALGESPWRGWWRITLPQLRPAIGAGALLVALYTLSDFGVVSLLQFESLTRALYLSYQAAFNRTPAALLGLLLVLIALLLVMGEARLRGRARYYRLSAGVARPHRVVALGRWQAGALVLCGLVVLLAVGLPLLVIIYWATLALRTGTTWLLVWATIRNSLGVATIAAVATSLAALPIALIAVRFPGRLGRWLERISYLGYALPGIVIALALVFFGARYATPLYQTLALLVFAYGVRFLPQAVGTTRAALLQVNPQLEEAAASLGSGRATVLRRITLPLVRPGLLGGSALVLLTTLKELPVTLLLSPIGFETLAVQIWSATGEALFTQAAVPALLLLLVALLPTTLLYLGEDQHA